MCLRRPAAQGRSSRASPGLSAALRSTGTTWSSRGSEQPPGLLGHGVRRRAGRRGCRLEAARSCPADSGGGSGHWREKQVQVTRLPWWHRRFPGSWFPSPSRGAGGLLRGGWGRGADITPRQGGACRPGDEGEQGSTAGPAGDPASRGMTAGPRRPREGSGQASGSRDKLLLLCLGLR